LSKKKKKKRKKIVYRDIVLNIMPFIDVFSLLNTFLLMSAVFLSVGIIEVQIPFLTSAPPDKKDDERSCDVKVDMEKDRIEATAQDCRGVDPKKEFKVTKEDIAQLHKYLVDIRRGNQDTDKVSFFTEDDVLWKDIAKVLDAIKLRQPGDPVFQSKSANVVEQAAAAEFVYPKVVMASVML
jgi:biopolymer transport protein ExbD